MLAKCTVPADIHQAVAVQSKSITSTMLPTILYLFVFCSVVHGAGRQLRALPFPESSTVGILAAIATPLNLPEREVFFSYNFEANYNSHAAFELASLDALKKYDIEGRSGSDTSSANGTNDTPPPDTKTPAKKRSIVDTFLSRQIVYKFFESKLTSFGLNGNACLLKTICQVADVALGRNNGVLGDLVHVIFTPSTSRDRVGKKYFRAEQEGAYGGCHRYNDRCPRSILDFISIADI